MKLYQLITEQERSNYKRRMMNDLRMEEMFSDNEINEQDDDVRADIINKINSDQWEKHDPRAYRESLMKSKHPGMLSDYSPAEFNSMKLFKLEGYDIGFALKQFQGKFQEIVAVFNNTGVGGLGSTLIQSAIKHGGCYLDHFDGFLTDLYQKNGFEEYNRDPFNPQYDQDGAFRKKYGEKDIIYRKHKNCK